MRTFLSAKKTSDKKFLLILILLAIFLRLLWAVLLEVEPVSDFSKYFRLATSLSQGLGYVASDGTPTAYFPIGYPAFLALFFSIFGSSLLFAKFLNVLLSAGTIAVFYVFSRNLIEKAEVRRWAAVLIAFFPSQIAYASLISDSILFQFLLYFGLWMIVKPIWYRSFLGGVVLGLSALTRPYGLLIPLIAGLFLWPKVRTSVKFRRMIITYFAVALIISPWIIRNYRIFNNFVLISNNGGINLLIGNGPGATGRYTDKPLASLNNQHSNELEMDQKARKIAVSNILNNPIRFLELGMLKTIYLYAEDAQALRWNLKGMPGRSGKEIRYGIADFIAMGFFQAYYCMVFLAFLFYFMRIYVARKPIEKVRLGGLWFIIYFTSIAFVFFASPRFHFPVIPIIALYAGAAFDFLFPVQLVAPAHVSKKNPGDTLHRKGCF
ncbi:MAG: glycosyltransferase family 39 protein [Candidatus Aminicenantes bacterium]|nr:glycosyltransferase family 39 protein [Candidatus Aminicenantes bacterium]